jgi:hypothetical protein
MRGCWLLIGVWGCGPGAGTSSDGTASTTETVDTSGPVTSDTGSPPLGCGSLLSVEGFGGSQGEGDPVIAIADDGTTYVAAYFQGEITLDSGGPGETTLDAEGTLDTVLARYGPSGELEWVRQIGGTSTASPRALEALPDGVAIAGTFAGTATVNVGEDDGQAFTSAGESDAFVASFNGAGALSWARAFGGVAQDYTEGLSVLDDGSVVVASTHHATVTLGAGEPGQTVIPLPVGAASTVSVGSYGGTGNLQWAQVISGALTSKVDDVTSDGNQVLIVGHVEGPGTAVFGLGQPTEIAVEATADVGYIARYAADATLLWVSTLGAWGPDALSIAGDGSALVTGAFSGSVVFAPGLPDEVSLSTAATDIFLARYSATGAFQWAIHSDTVTGGLTTPYDIAAEPGGGAVVVGSLSDRARFGAGEANEASLVADGLWDGYAARYDADGTLVCARQIGGLKMDASFSVVRRPDGMWEVGGYFSETAAASFGESDAQQITASGGTDIFRAAYVF